MCKVNCGQPNNNNNSHLISFIIIKPRNTFLYAKSFTTDSDIIRDWPINFVRIYLSTKQKQVPLILHTFFSSLKQNLFNSFEETISYQKRLDRLLKYKTLQSKNARKLFSIFVRWNQWWKLGSSVPCGIITSMYSGIIECIRLVFVFWRWRSLRSQYLLAFSENHQNRTFVNVEIKSKGKRQTCLQDRMNNVLHKQVHNSMDKT